MHHRLARIAVCFGPVLYGGTGSTMAQHALRFDGTDDFVSVTDTGGFDFDSAFTVEAWVQPFSLESAGNFKAVVQGTFSEPPFVGGGWTLFLGFEDPSNWGLSVCTPACNAATSQTGGLVVDEWQHLAATYDGTSIAIYRNGQFVSATPQTGDVADIGFVLIGFWESAIDGLIDEVRIWNIARGEAAIQADMNVPLQGDEAGLVGYWQFDQGSGQVAADTSGHHNTGRLGSSPNEDANDPSWEASTAVLPLARFLRCDPNDDGKTNVADGVWILNELFRGGAATACPAAADCNGDRRKDLRDGLYAISYQFTDGPPPPSPFPDCGRVQVPPEECPPGSTLCP